MYIPVGTIYWKAAAGLVGDVGAVGVAGFEAELSGFGADGAVMIESGFGRLGAVGRVGEAGGMLASYAVREIGLESWRFTDIQNTSFWFHRPRLD